jgi:hypothetical protein
MNGSDSSSSVARHRLESERRLALLVTRIMFVPNAAFAFADRAVVSNPRPCGCSTSCASRKSCSGCRE